LALLPKVAVLAAVKSLQMMLLEKKQQVIWQNQEKRILGKCLFKTNMKLKNHLPGFTSRRTKPICGLRVATDSAMHPPKESPRRYIDLFGDMSCSCLIHFSMICSNSA
jgi:hypothetical protein